MYTSEVEKARKEILSIEKFFAAYQSATTFFSTQHIVSQMPPQIAHHAQQGIKVRLLESAPTGKETEEIPAIAFSENDLKRYMLDEGQFLIFNYSFKLFYSAIENFIRECTVSKYPSKSGKILYLEPSTFQKLSLDHIDKDITDLIYILKETRNCLVHNDGVWDYKSAEKLSNVIIGIKDPDYSLILGTSSGESFRTPVGSKLNLPINRVATIKWMSSGLLAFLKAVETT